VIPSFFSQGRARPARRADQHGPSAVSHGGRRISDRRPLLHCWGWDLAARTLGGQGGRRRGVPQGADAGADQGARGGARGQEHPGDQGRGREKQPWDGDDDSAVPRYNRRIEMPAADAYKMDKIKAEMKNGVLWVTLLKVKEEERKDVFHVKVE
uniref:SHSP domain-containing protein n=2 Tax=Aegilops tauschii subsp. strangulata TaxID=200361 RepID=A0A453R4W8_AEGTS